MNRATSNRRLLKLADFLSTLPRKRFNYGSWVGWNWQGAPDLSCGTTACALGWATTIPAFRRLGLSLTANRSVSSPSGAGERAAIHVFGVTELEALYLFTPDTAHPDFYSYYNRRDRRRSPGHDATPKRVAAHIRAFVLTRRDSQ